MNENYLPFCHAWFEDYVNGFHSSEKEIQESIELKIGHTFRVCNNITKIARSLNLGGEDLSLAEVIALFHDVGRFEQLRMHRTFNDVASVDHAALGLSLRVSRAIL